MAVVGASRQCFTNHIVDMNRHGLAVEQRAIAGGYGDGVGGLSLIVRVSIDAHHTRHRINREVRSIRTRDAVTQGCCIVQITVSTGHGVHRCASQHVFIDADAIGRSQAWRVIHSSDADRQKLRIRVTLVIGHHKTEGVVRVGFQPLDGTIIWRVNIRTRCCVHKQSAIRTGDGYTTRASTCTVDAVAACRAVIGISRNQRSTHRAEDIVR